ncbi:MAG TPA: MarR family transcriptional regulator [Streptosporangiaceae bacterium]
MGAPRLLLLGSVIRASQRVLADHTGLEPLYVSKLARALEAGGLIERVPDPDDTRAMRLSLTTDGHAVTLSAVAIVRRLMDQMLAPLGGLGGLQTSAFVRELTALLDVPLDPQFTDLKE